MTKTRAILVECSCFVKGHYGVNTTQSPSRLLNVLLELIEFEVTARLVVLLEVYTNTSNTVPVAISGTCCSRTLLVQRYKYL